MYDVNNNSKRLLVPWKLSVIVTNHKIKNSQNNEYINIKIQ